MKNISILLLMLILLTGSGCATLDRSFLPGEKPAFAIKNLRDIPTHSSAELLKNAQDRDMYLIVHPSYYVFFHDKEWLVPYEESKNVVGSFLDTQFSDNDAIVHLMKEYEKAEMQFLTGAKADKKLVVLILPGNHVTASQYLYKDTPDAYAQYVNKMTQDAETIFYLESKNASTGKLFDLDKETLLDFIHKTNAKKVFIGGGYIGRCQKEIYNFLAEKWSDKDVAIVPEISAFSPADLNEPTARMLLTSDMKINKPALNSFIANGGVKGLGMNRPNLANIP
jgi:hypothetical protein